MKLSDMAPLGVWRADVGNWQKRLTFTSDLADVSYGQHRDYSYQNTVELALIAAFVTAGMPPSKAVAWARPFVTDARGVGLRFGHQEQWLVIPAGDFSQAKPTNNPQLSELADLLTPNAPPVFALVNIAEIFRRVDQIFTASQES